MQHATINHAHIIMFCSICIASSCISSRLLAVTFAMLTWTFIHAHVLMIIYIDCVVVNACVGHW